MTARPPSDFGFLRCPACGYPVPGMTITNSTVPVESLRFCGSCGVQVLDDGTVGAPSWDVFAEHYEGEILRFPKIDLTEADDG